MTYQLHGLVLSSSILMFTNCAVTAFVLKLWCAEVLQYDRAKSFFWNFGSTSCLHLQEDWNIFTWTPKLAGCEWVQFLWSARSPLSISSCDQHTHHSQSAEHHKNKLQSPWRYRQQLSSIRGKKFILQGVHVSTYKTTLHYTHVQNISTSPPAKKTELHLLQE
jgi:hypothetical protein